MDDLFSYEKTMEELISSCEKHLTNFRQEHPSRHDWVSDPISLDQVKKIMADLDLQWQPGFSEVPDLDNTWFVEPKFPPPDGPCPNYYGIAFDAAGGIYMSMY